MGGALVREGVVEVGETVSRRQECKSRIQKTGDRKLGV